MPDRIDQTDFPRVTLKCKKCANEFQVNVLRFRDHESVNCQVCGNVFSKETGEKFANALQSLFEVKYDLEKSTESFDFTFIYKTTHSQPPVPYTFDQE